MPYMFYRVIIQNVSTFPHGSCLGTVIGGCVLDDVDNNNYVIFVLMHVRIYFHDNSPRRVTLWRCMFWKGRRGI